MGIYTSHHSISPSQHHQPKLQLQLQLLLPLSIGRSARKMDVHPFRSVEGKSGDLASWKLGIDEMEDAMLPSSRLALGGCGCRSFATSLMRAVYRCWLVRVGCFFLFCFILSLSTPVVFMTVVSRMASQMYVSRAGVSSPANRRLTWKRWFYCRCGIR